MASKCYESTLVLVRQELQTLRVLIWVQVLVLLVEKNVVRLRQSVESLQHSVQCLGTFCAMENQGLLGGFDELRLARFQDTRSARVLGFSVKENISQVEPAG